MNRITVKITGPAGMGIKSAGLVLAKIVTESGYYFADYSEYPSLIRGGHNTYQITFANEEVFMVDKKADILVSLVAGHEEDRVNLWTIPLPSNIYANTMAIGALVFRLGLDKKIAKKIIEERFGEDGKNLEAFEDGYVFASKNSKIISVESTGNENKTMIVDGSEALAWGLVKGGLDFFAAYPMTPVSGVLHFLAKNQDEFGVKVFHPEDEIAVASMATGASIAGARSAVATSGGGFALMNETVSLDGVLGVGVVYIMGQRPGPATGLPTWTAQGDLLYTVFAGHGEFPKIVLAPGTVAESFEMARRAINLANKYDVPVIVLTDKMICESAVNTKEMDKEEKIVEKSMKKIPGQGPYLYNSYEHDEVDGYSVEDSESVIKGVGRRLKKMEEIKKDTPKVLLLGAKKAKKLIVSWGSTKGAIMEALKGRDDYAYLQIKTVWPIDKEIGKIINGFETKILIENNALGQLGQLLKSQMSINFDKTILKYNGRPFFPDEIKEALL